MSYQKSPMEYHPERILNVNETNVPPYAVMVLNRPINLPLPYILPFWNNASVRMTVDGGTDRWFSFLKSNNIDLTGVANVDIVSGDFDSISKDKLLEIKQNSHVEVGFTPDQDETDFTKAIKLLSSHCDKNNIELDSLVVVCQSSGRMDQIMANINTLYKFQINKLMNTTSLYLLSDDSLTWLLNDGTSVIHVPNMLIKPSKNGWCALMPIGSKAVVTTEGLKWNLDNMAMEFGGMVSTSNEFGTSSTVLITTNEPLLWSMGIIPLFSKLYQMKDEDYN